MFDIGNTNCLLLLCNFKRLCHYQTCVHVCGIVYYHDATQCFASEIQFVYCYSETIIQCAILMLASTFVELYITMLRMSALHRRVKLSIVTLIFYSTAAFSRYASTCVEPFWSSIHGGSLTRRSQSVDTVAEWKMHATYICHLHHFLSFVNVDNL